MSTGHWATIEALFEAALAVDREQRAAFLARECPDPVLRQEVERLLAADDGNAGDAMQDILGRSAQRLLLGQVTEGEVIGAYRVIRLLGEGGMGAVYLAERADGAYDQRVAIKVLRAGSIGPALMARFRYERQILAGLRHPNIASLLDGGSSASGVPYLVMEYIDGEPLFAHCRSRRLRLPERLALFVKLCAAVQAAHQGLVIHRDIKSANVLVDRAGEPKLLDFGVARLLAGDAPDATQTAIGNRAFTPEFASPEQIRGDRITTASDVYSLGVLLYGLLTGQSPYQRWRDQPLALQQAVCEVEPPRPSESLDRDLPAAGFGDDGGITVRTLTGDLDHIVLKAMRKEPGQRYASPAALADDIGRYLEQRPIEARRGSRRYVLNKFLRRHWRPVSAAAAALLVFASTVGFYTQRLQVSRDLAERERAAAQQLSDFAFGLFRAANPYEQKPGLNALDLLDRGAKRVDTELAGQPRLRARMQRFLAEAYWQQGQAERAEALYAQAIAAGLSTPDGLKEAADAADSLGLNLLLTERFDETRRAIEQARDLHGRLYGRQGPKWEKKNADYGLDLLNLSMRSDGRIASDEQYALIQDIKRSYEAAGLSESRAYGAVLAAQSNWHKKRFEWAQALKFQGLSRPHFTREHGPDHIYGAFNLEDTGRLQFFMGDYAAARTTLRRVLEIITTFKGADSADLTWSLYYLARLERETGHRAVASELTDRLIAIETAKPATEDQRYLARALALRALLRADAGELDPAQADAERSHALLVASQQTRVQLDVAYEALGTVAMARGDAASALTYWRTMDVLRRLELDPAQTDTPQAIALHASALAATGDMTTAAAHFSEAIALAEQRYDAQYPTIGRTLLARARLHDRAGNTAAANADRARADAIFERRGMVPQGAAWTLPDRP